MFILGDLICLNKDEERLPLPWWHRAPLAFESGTSVYIALTKAKEDRPGDILVTVLDTNHWDKMIRIRCKYQDAPGVIAKAFGVVADCQLNIALAETVTVEGGRLHALDLYCEPVGFPREKLDHIKLKESLIEKGFLEALIEELESPKPPIVWHRKGEVNSGWVISKGKSNWKEQVIGQIKDLAQEGNFDINKLVLSADTEKRFLRFVIPRSGAITITIEHADEPGALRELTHALQRVNLNVLSCLLKRGGVPFGNAVLVAICEPACIFPEQEIKLLKTNIKKEIEKVPQRYRPDLKLKSGVRADKVIYSRHREDIVIHVPNHLKPRVIDMRNKVDRRKYTIFLSQRFIDERIEKYAKEIRRVLKENNCEIVQASILSGGTQTSFDEVSSAMWAAAAGIVLVAQPEDESEVAFSFNLAHEFGFLQGQGKPLLLLVEGETKVLGDLDKFTNAKGITAPRFTKENAFNRDHQESIEYQVKKWLNISKSCLLFSGGG